jgi:thiosulfate dehydrogenase [quinone] large subunit
MFAGLQKLANPNFLNANNPSGIQAQMIAAARFSPLHVVMGHLLRFSTPLGVLISLGELAVGIGTLLGLWTRIAAIGGMALSLTLFLTVSFHASPYYTGADIVFLFAWMPMVVAGSGGVLSLDLVIASLVRRREGLGSPVTVPIAFSEVRQVCGSFEDDRCRARRGAPCEPHGCPFLLATRRRTASVPDVGRRTVVLGGVAAGVVAVGSLVLAGLAAGIGRLVGGAKPPPGSAEATLPSGSGKNSASSTTGPRSTTTTTATPSTATSTSTPGSGATSTTAPPTTTSPSTTTPVGTSIGPASDVPVGGAARFTDPSSGDPGLVLQPERGRFLAYDAVCPHAGCTVGYSSAADLIVCPCHGSEFNPATGAVVAGPAPRGLAVIPIQEGGDGRLYVS